VNQRDASALDQISFWDTGAPSYRWNELAIAKYAYHCSRPSEVDPSLPTVLATPASPAYPSELAAHGGRSIPQ
jgi:hypothetical protein